MRRFILSATAAIVVLAAASPALGADDISTSPDWAIAAKGGVWDTDLRGVGAAPAYGAEISVNDPFLDPALGRISPHAVLQPCRP
ncbi:MAG: hypothetical protein NVV74_12905 [Magnetospirillum sp.]|nr:hypothetical protein [Magnetospirillum sp.]